MKFDIKAYKKEIIIILIYVILFSALGILASNVKTNYEKLQRQEKSLSTKYTSLLNNKSTEAELQKELDDINKQIELASAKLPANFRSQDINKMLIEIISNTGNIFSFQDCKIGQETKGTDYNSFQVSVSNVNTTEEQFEYFLKYISEYKVKTKISSINLTNTNNAIRGNMTLQFFGSKK